VTGNGQVSFASEIRLTIALCAEVGDAERWLEHQAN
jgi:hypothetical protein